MLCNNTKFGKHKLQFKSIPIYNQIYSDILFYNAIQARNMGDISINRGNMSIQFIFEPLL